MNGKSTPAPWSQKHRQGSDESYRTEIFSEQYGGIATCEWTPQNLGNGVTGTYREANARLIAAAPELLEALKDICQAYAWVTYGECRGWSEDRPMLTMHEALDKSKVAIAKAQGAQA